MTHRARLSLATGSVLMVATGFVDAYTFLRHGHVFAQAMTGNLVLVAIGAFDPAVVAFWLPLVAYLAFMAGVAVVWAWSQAWARRLPAPQVATLALQVLVLVVVGFLPDSVPAVAVTACIAFTAGMQIAAFRELGRAAFTTTVMTTNSMRTVNAALSAFGDPEQRSVARTYGTALACFVAGAFLGAFLSTRWGDRAAWADAALFALAGALYLAERRR